MDSKERREQDRDLGIVHPESYNSDAGTSPASADLEDKTELPEIEAYEDKIIPLDDSSDEHALEGTEKDAEEIRRKLTQSQKVFSELQKRIDSQIRSIEEKEALVEKRYKEFVDATGDDVEKKMIELRNVLGELIDEINDLSPGTGVE